MTRQKGKAKIQGLPDPMLPARSQPLLRKPHWIRAKAVSGERVAKIRAVLREHNLHSVCEEASCPNLGECFGQGKMTFLILGDQCTRRCPFCDIAHGQPAPPDPEEAEKLAVTVAQMRLDYIVITSVNRDDLRDGGASQFVACVQAIRNQCSNTRVEILVPDFRGRESTALSILSQALPDVFNHNLETVPRLYRRVRPGADYHGSLQLLQRFKQAQPNIDTKSGLMLGLGETLEEVEQVITDLHSHGCDRITIGQYLQPSKYHLPVERYVSIEEFELLANAARTMGFKNVFSAPMVRSSYHADKQEQIVVE